MKVFLMQCIWSPDASQYIRVFLTSGSGNRRRYSPRGIFCVQIFITNTINHLSVRLKDKWGDQ